MSATAAEGRVGSRAAEEVAQARRAAGRPLLSLHGSPSLPLPAHVRAAAEAALAQPGPRPSRGLPQLREAIAAMLLEATGRQVDPARELLVTQGAMQAVNLLLRTLLRDGGNVIVPAPGFFFAEMVRRAGGEARPVATRAADGWAWDRVALAAAADGDTRAILFANPGNPTGHLPQAGELEAALEVASGHGAVVVSDESYERFVYAGGARPFVSLLERWAEHAVVVRSLSKSHALGDWRVGFVVAPPPLSERLTWALEWECLHCAHLPQVVGAAALRGPQEWIERALAPYAANRDAVVAAVERAPLLAAGRPDAIPFLWIDATALEQARGRPAEELLTDAGIPAVGGAAFEAPGWVRVPFGGEPDTIARLCAALEEVGGG